MHGTDSTSSRAAGSTIRRDRSGGSRRALPTGRALVGGLLVTLAAVVVFATYAGAQDTPTSTVVVATRALDPGARLSPADVELRTVDLGGELLGRSFGSIDDLVGAVTLAPLAAGDLVQASAVRTVGAGSVDPDDPQFSFAVERDRALNGELRPGEIVDLLATFGTGTSASTKVLASSARVLAVEQAGSGTLGSSGRLVLTVALDDDDTVLDVAHASQVAAITVVRASGDGA
jgi:Flp pilus assembly protein CpaB